MKEVLSVFTFGIGTLLFVAFLATLNPSAVTAAPRPGASGNCANASATLGCSSKDFAVVAWRLVVHQ
jgi:hypothetical protein